MDKENTILEHLKQSLKEREKNPICLDYARKRFMDNRKSLEKESGNDIHVKKQGY